MIRPMRLNRFYVETEIVPVTRLWEAEIPVGDPFSGPAFGDKHKKLVKSVVKVVKKVAPIALGVAAAFATGGAFLAASGFAGGLAALAPGIAFAGSALSLVGTVTGNEKLTKIGSVLGLAGGVGMVGANTAKALSDGVGFSDAVLKGLQDTAQQLKQGSQESWARLTGSPVGGAMGGAEAQLSNTPEIGQIASEAAGSPVDLSGGELAKSATGVSDQVAAAASGGGQTLAQPTGIINSTMNSALSPGLDGPAGDLKKGLISQMWDGAKSAGKFIGDKENANLVLAGGNILSSVLPSEKDEAERALYEARARQIEDELAGRERFNASIRGQSSLQVNPTAQVFNPRSAYVPGRSGGYDRGLAK